LSALRPCKVGLRGYSGEIKNNDEYDIRPTRKIYIERTIRTSMKTPALELGILMGMSLGTMGT
jgi:hypothetical protein